MFEKEVYFVVYDKANDEMIAIFENYYRAIEFAEIYGARYFEIEPVMLSRPAYYWYKFITWLL